MIFSSLTFIFLLFPLALMGDQLARRCSETWLRNAILLFISLIFYTWGEGAKVVVLIVLGLFNYGVGRLLPNSKHPRLWMVFGVTSNLAVLVHFKYAVWLLSLLWPALALPVQTMPLGISFFIFHAVSYLIDVYRKDVEPARSSLNFLTYFCMFPHLVAGPIVRYAQVQKDLQARGPDRELFSFGMYRFLLGLNKKVIIANSVAVLADSAFSMGARNVLSTADAWVGILAYAVQIYFDFSGYSDMAIGLAAMAGFHFEENFLRPYSSRSIKEFWRRWHISLSSWFRDYLYIPAGGSRLGQFSTYRNLLLVFFFCGLWHGANLTFIIWGLWHGTFLVLERLPFGRRIDAAPVFVGRAYTLLVVLIGWVFFRADNILLAMEYLNALFSFQSASLSLLYYHKASLILVVALTLCLLPDRFFPAAKSHTPGDFSFAAYASQACLAFISLAFLLTSARNPFIYFNF